MRVEAGGTEESPEKFSDNKIKEMSIIAEKWRFVLIVGDKFQEFSKGKDVMTISQLRVLLSAPSGLVLCERMKMVPGQGLSDQDIVEIRALAAVSALHDRLDFTWWTAPKRAERALSHKYHVENTLISAPRQIGEDIFEVALLVDEKSELMGDHQTGQHLQGMLMVEAARQAFLAITEEYFLPRGDAEFYFIFNNLVVEYKRFIFPLAANLRCCVQDKEDSGNSRRFAMEAFVEQAGSEAARISCSFTVVKFRSVSKMEQSLARDVVTHHFATLSVLNRGELAIE